MFQGIHHIEYYVGNAYTSAYFYTRALGFAPLAEAGLQTGARDRQSYVVEQGEIRLVFTNAVHPDSPIAQQVRLHGDGVHDVALAVGDARRAYQRCLQLGATPVAPPRDIQDEAGRATVAVVRTFGETVHSLVERTEYHGAFLPEFRRAVVGRTRPGARIAAVDHVAICVEAGGLDRWVDFYERAFGFHQVHQEDIVTEHSAMNSKVVASEDGAIKFPIMEPAHGRSKSQIEEYLDYHHGPGAQHLALLSTDICATARALREGGVEFMRTPASYYDALAARIGPIDESIPELRELDLLADRDRWGYLLQVFTRPVTGRPTGFLEIVQRKGARGFGAGNVRALFEAVEREQAARGNL